MGQKADELEKQVTKLSVHTVARLEREVEEAKISVGSLQAQLEESEASLAQKTQVSVGIKVVVLLSYHRK
jgi:hypothetical protein